MSSELHATRRSPLIYFWNYFTGAMLVRCVGQRVHVLRTDRAAAGDCWTVASEDTGGSSRRTCGHIGTGGA